MSGKLVLGGWKASIYKGEKEGYFLIEYWGFPRNPKTFFSLESAIKEYNELNERNVDWRDIGKVPTEKKVIDEYVPSFSDPSKKYHVVGTIDSLTCDCVGFGFRRTCSHVDAVKELINGRETEEA